MEDPQSQVYDAALQYTKTLAPPDTDTRARVQYSRYECPANRVEPHSRYIKGIYDVKVRIHVGV